MKAPFSIAVLFSLLAAASLGAFPVTMHLSGDRTLNVDFDHANADGVVWRMNPGDINTQLTPLAEVSHIDFPPPPSWEEAEEILATGDLDASLKKFTAIAKDQFALGYPVPGNYASRALIELLDIRRRMLDAAAIADQARVLRREAPTLPLDQRELAPVVEAWIALGKEEWESALKALDSIEDDNSEVYYIRGRVLEATGDDVNAVESYADTYALGIGDRSEMSRDALRRSAQILAKLGNDARFPELHAQLKLYAELYGAGSLWKDAPEHFVKTAAAKLDTISGMVDEPIVKEEDAPAIDLAALPPIEEREWILTREIDPKIYFVGQPPLVADGDVARLDGGWLFGGGTTRLHLPDKITLYQKQFRVRLSFTPKEKNGILLNALEDSGGFDLYLENGELKFSWSRQLNGADRKTFTLGNALLGIENRLSLQVTSKNEVRAYFNGLQVIEGAKVPDLINFKTELPFAVGGRSADGFIPADEMPSFTGAIHHLCIGAEEDITAVHEKEMAMFGGKQVRFDPPAPPAPAPEKAVATTPAPAQPAAPDYTPPTITYDLTKLPRALDRDWILPQELEHRIIFIGRSPVINRDAVKTEAGWTFDGKTSRMQFEPVSFQNRRLRLRALFTPKKPDAAILHASVRGVGLLGIYAVDGELVLIHRRNLGRRTRPTTFKLGKILPGVVNNLSVHFADNNLVRGHLNGQAFPKTFKYGGPITEKSGLDLSIGGARNSLTGREVPGFEGTIHCMILGLEATQKKVTERELEVLNDRTLRFGPPPPAEAPAPLVPKIKK